MSGYNFEVGAPQPPTADKLEERMKRQAAITALAEEMKSTVPKLDIRKQSTQVAIGDDDDEDFEIESIEESGFQGHNKQESSKVDKGGEFLKSFANVDLSVTEYAFSNRIPVSHKVDLGGHKKAVTCVSSEPAGNRIVTGSLDYSVNFYDFGGMDQRHKAFRTEEAEDGYPVVAVSHSPNGDRFIVATGSSQPKIYSRDGEFIIQFCKGDMYLRDLAHIKGHMMEITGAQWHPKEREIVLTSSLDGSIRIWDLLGDAAFGKLMSKHVLKIRGVTGQQRVGVTSCCFSNDGNIVVGGAADGSIQLWRLAPRKTYSQPDVIWRPGHKANTAVTCVVVSPDNKILASRGQDGCIKLWDITTKKPQPALRVFEDLFNQYSTANLDFSPDGTYLICATSISRESKEDKSLLCFLAVPPPGSDVGDREQPHLPSLKIAIAQSVSGIAVKWVPKTYQILVTTSAGYTTIFFDPRLSIKGAMLTSARAPKRELDVADATGVGLIYNPHALPLFREELPGMKRRVDRNKKDPRLAKVPEKPPAQGPGRSMNTSFFFTQYVMEGRKKDTSREEDPREALLKLDEHAKSDPIFIGRAYKETQPVPLMMDNTFEEEQEEFKKKQKVV